MYHHPLDLIRAAKDTTAPPLNIYDGPTAKLKSIFAGLLNALHESRRINAERLIHQYRALIAQAMQGSQSPRGQPATPVDVRGAKLQSNERSVRTR
jgi:hypothetical protein